MCAAQFDSNLAWTTVPLNSTRMQALAHSGGFATDAGKEGVSNAVATRRAAGRALVMHLLQQTAGGDWTIETDSRGKPVACGAAVRHVSIAHSGGTLAAAVSALGPVGIDVERHNPARQIDRLALAAFGPAEQATVARHGLPAFYRIWTLREAISKATGDGMALVVDGVDRVPPDMLGGSENAGAWSKAADGWHLAHLEVEPGLSLALALQAAPGALSAGGLGDLRLAV